MHFFKWHGASYYAISLLVSSAGDPVVTFNDHFLFSDDGASSFSEIPVHDNSV